VSIARFSVRQGVMVNLLFFVCVLAGLLAYVRTPVDFFPDISFNVAVVTTVWTGASADEVERLVTSEIEDEIDGIDGIKDLWSQSNDAEQDGAGVRPQRPARGSGPGQRSPRRRGGAVPARALGFGGLSVDPDLGH
jgi:hypothetical protein